VGVTTDQQKLRLASRAPTLQQRMQAVNGRSSGFDYLRICLATSIILWHGIPVSYGGAYELEIWRGPLGVLMHATLPMFFALSGFLVAGSFDRCPTLVSFFGLRILRIVPALMVEVVVSALLLGPLLTAWPPARYFADSTLYVYFLNILGLVHYHLPGVFLDNPLPGLVNAQLWTIPFELQCYMALGGLAVAGVMRRRYVLLLFTLYFQGQWAWQAIIRGDDGSSNGASGPVLIICFLAGILAHLFRDRLPFSRSLFWLTLAASLILSALPHGAYYLPLPITYLTVYLGLLDPKRVRWLLAGDYSYGMYLYGYPLQQAVATLGPGAHSWTVNVVVALPAAFLVALLSWHFVEKPALQLRRHVPDIERRMLDLFWNRRPGAPSPRSV